MEQGEYQLTENEQRINFLFMLLFIKIPAFHAGESWYFVPSGLYWFESFTIESSFAIPLSGLHLRE